MITIMNPMMMIKVKMMVLILILIVILILKILSKRSMIKKKVNQNQRNQIHKHAIIQI